MWHMGHFLMKALGFFIVPRNNVKQKAHGLNRSHEKYFISINRFIWCVPSFVEINPLILEKKIKTLNGYRQIGE